MKIAAATLLALVACGRGGDVVALGGAREVRIGRGELSDRVLLTGRLRAASTIDLTVPKTEVWQLTIRWLAEDGAAVKAGDKVLEFDNSSFTAGLEAKRLQLQDAVSSFRTFSDVSAMANAVKSFELQLARVARDKARLVASVPGDLLPQRTAQERQLDLARNELAVARADGELDAARQASALELRVKQIELDKATRAIEAAERTIGQLVISAPIDGVILVGSHPWEGHPFRIGDTVQPGFAILSLPDLHATMHVEAELSDVDDGRVAIGTAGVCTLDAYPNEAIPCVVEDLAPVARASHRESPRRVFGVGLKLAHSDPERMRPGMSVKVELPAGRSNVAVVVPRGAVIEDANRARVRMADGELRDVSLAGCDAQRCAVVPAPGGLVEGDVVLEGVP